MASGGAYRIESSTLNKEFPAPESTVWNEQLIADGLNGIPVNTSYKVHLWNLRNLEGCDYEDLATLFQSQQNANSQLIALETDPYDASGADMKYGTATYVDFIIKSIDPRTRGLPLYENVIVTFEVHVG